VSAGPTATRPRAHLIVVAAAALALLQAADAGAALTESARLAVVYDAILDAQFDHAATLLKQTCPPAPVEACAVLAEVSLWWQIQIRPDRRTLDSALEISAARAIAATARWTRREPERAEAWFYLAAAYGPLVQWRVLRGERITAAREAKKIKDALDRALQIDPDLDDAYFGIGLYHYYADVAPTYAKMLRWLLFLPGGDRLQGLEEMHRARERGDWLRGEADFQLHILYLWYEQRPRDALELLQSLDARYPANPIFLERIAQLHDTYFHDLDASADAWRTLRDRARDGRVFDAATIAKRADEKMRAIISRHDQLF
jgi:tetratricopeptide (TPR) repeat protein